MGRKRTWWGDVPATLTLLAVFVLAGCGDRSFVDSPVGADVDPPHARPAVSYAAARLSWGTVVNTPCVLNGVPNQGAPGGWLVRLNATGLPLDDHPEYFNVLYSLALTNARAVCALTKDWPGAEMCDVSPIIGSDPLTYGTQYYMPDESPLQLCNGPLDGLFVIPNDATSPVSITFVTNDASRGYPITAPSIPYAGPLTLVLRGPSARPAFADTLRAQAVR